MITADKKLYVFAQVIAQQHMADFKVHFKSVALWAVWTGVIHAMLFLIEVKLS